jgi:hypothetical protein
MNTRLPAAGYVATTEERQPRARRILQAGFIFAVL